MVTPVVEGFGGAVDFGDEQVSFSQSNAAKLAFAQTVFSEVVAHVKKAWLKR